MRIITRPRRASTEGNRRAVPTLPEDGSFINGGDWRRMGGSAITGILDLAPLIMTNYSAPVIAENFVFGALFCRKPSSCSTDEGRHISYTYIPFFNTMVLARASSGRSEFFPSLQFL